MTTAELIKENAEKLNDHDLRELLKFAEYLRNKAAFVRERRIDHGGGDPAMD